MNFTTKHLEAAIEAQREVDLFQFRHIFGERLGSHLWTKFMDHEQHLLDFARYLDDENFDKLADYLDRRLEAKMSTKKHKKMHAIKPSPQHLRKLFTEHGADLLEWPAPARMWIVTDPAAGEYISKHAPGMLSITAQAVGEWTQMSLLGFAERDGSGDSIPF